MGQKTQHKHSGVPAVIMNIPFPRSHVIILHRVIGRIEQKHGLGRICALSSVSLLPFTVASCATSSSAVTAVTAERGCRGKDCR